jgi:hypothetical protein
VCDLFGEARPAFQHVTVAARGSLRAHRWEPAFGGVRSPKTVALKWTKDGQVIEWNALFAGVALDLGLGIEVCWPSSPEQRGSIENLVGWATGSFFKQGRFLDDADLLTQQVNTQRPCRATRMIPAVRLEEERPRLRSLKVAPAQLALRVPIVVGPTAAVVHDTHPYSMPPRCDWHSRDVVSLSRSRPHRRRSVRSGPSAMDAAEHGTTL